MMFRGVEFLGGFFRINDDGNFFYKADKVSEGNRVTAFGIFSGVVSVATVCGTLVARLLPTDRIYQVLTIYLICIRIKI